MSEFPALTLRAAEVLPSVGKYMKMRVQQKSCNTVSFTQKKGPRTCLNLIAHRCNNKNMQQQKDATTKRCNNKKMHQQKEATVKEAIAKRFHSKRMQ